MLATRVDSVWGGTARTRRSGLRAASQRPQLAPIERLVLRDNRRRIEQMFASVPDRPCIVTDAAAEWPARSKWNLDYFASRYGSNVGLAPLGFGARKRTRGKATLLGAFIEHLGEPYDAIPGVWVDTDAKSAMLDDALAWSFDWEPFRSDPALFDDISPFPSAIPNMTANLSRDDYDAMESIHGRHFDAIYISRRNTVTPLHHDWHHTFGCLVQFHGRKKVALLPPGPYRPSGEDGFDPESPNYDLYPAMRDQPIHMDVLQPFEMLIIPPDWLHYTRSEDHSITFSHNFFNRSNFDAHMRCVREDAAKSPEKTKLFDDIYAALAPAA